MKYTTKMIIEDLRNIIVSKEHYGQEKA